MSAEIEIEEDARSGRILLEVKNSAGRYSIFLTPADFQSLKRKVNKRKLAKASLSNETKFVGIQKAWRGDTNIVTSKLRRFLVKLVMPQLAKQLNRPY